jgi:uncharacterized membrane protein YeaQ/YmgE (transglycosylase-associated protein family)
MIMFLVLNTSGLTIIPTTILAFRASYGAAQPTDVFIPILLATTVATLAGIIITAAWQRIDLFQPMLVGVMGALVGGVALIIWGFGLMDKDTMGTVTSLVGNLIPAGHHPSLHLAGLFKKVNVYDAFIDGARRASPQP